MENYKSAERKFQDNLAIDLAGVEKLVDTYKGGRYLGIIKTLATPKSVIVDCMGGSGTFAAILHNNGYRNITTFDISDNHVRHAKTLFKKRGMKVRAFVSDIEDIKLPDNFADLVIIMTSMHHLAKRKKALSECRRILKNGGNLLIVEPNKLNPYAYYVHATSLRSPGEKLIGLSNLTNDLDSVFPGSYCAYTTCGPFNRVPFINKFGHKIVAVAKKARQADDKMKVSVVIPTKNEEKRLPDTLKSIKRTGVAAETIIVDAGSRDRTVEIARKFGCAVFEETGKKSPANAKNIGISHAKGDIIVLLNSDQILDVNFFRDIEKINYGWDALYTKETAFEDTLVEKLFALRCCRTGYTRFPHVLKKYVLKKVKFDPNLALGEENDWIKTVSASGFSSKRCDAVIYGHAPKDVRGLYVQLRWYGRTALNYFAKYKSISAFSMLSFILLPLLFFNHPVSTLSFPVWIYEAIIMAGSFIKKPDAAILLFPAFDFLRGVFFLAGMFEFVAGRTRTGR